MTAEEPRPLCPRAASTGLPCAAANPETRTDAVPCQACAASLPPMCVAGHGPMIKVGDRLHECATCSFKAVEVDRG